MAKYKCKSLGVCEKATAAEIFDRTAGDDLKCPSCGSPLLPLDTPASGGGRSKTPLVAGAVAALALLAGGGYYLTASRTKASETPPSVQESPASAVAVAASVPAPVAAPASAPVVAAPTAASGIAPSEAETKALRKDSQDKLTAGDAASAEQAGNKAAANEMLKLAIAKMSQGKLEELLAARERDPKQSLVSYNLAVLRLKQGRKDDALKEFEASFMAGFSHFNQMDQDTDLDNLRKDPRFNDLIAQYRKPGK
jgi:hypothetical protein